MKVFLKENLVLVAGVTLPLLLTLIFFAATFLDRVIADPPQYKVIFATNYYYNNSNSPYKISVKDNQVRFLYFPLKKESEYRNWQIPRLFIYNPVTNNTKEIELPTVEDPDVKISEIVKDLASEKVTSLQMSPDGYKFEYEYRSNGNLMTELFGGGSRSRSHYILRKGSTKIRVPSTTGYYYNPRFIGWIVDDQEVGK